VKRTSRLMGPWMGGVGLSVGLVGGGGDAMMMVRCAIVMMFRRGG